MANGRKKKYADPDQYERKLENIKHSLLLRSQRNYETRVSQAGSVKREKLS